MHRRRLLALSGSLLAGALAGCSAPTPLSGIEATGPNVDPDVEEATLSRLVSDTNAFSIDLYDRMVAEDAAGNTIASPLSVTTTLAMAIAGARGDTRAQMQETLRYSLEGNDLHEAFNALQRDLADRGEEIDPESLPQDYDESDDAVPFELSLVNAVWGQTGFPFEDEYLQVLSDHYEGGLRETDFKADAERARRGINGWVADETQDRIDELLPEGSLDSLTRLVLTNVVYFKANWQFPFEADATEQQPFTALDGSTSEVPMMGLSETLPYAEVNGAKAVELPYLGGTVSMVLILPPEGSFEEYETEFDAETFSTIVDELEQTEGSVDLPRFEFSGSSKLKPMLEAMGMESAFEPREADFSGMVDLEATDENLYLSEVFHDAYIGVDETGTEAAAATGAVVGLTSAPLEPFEFVADRPFMLAIRDRPTDAILFLGRVVDAGAAQ